MRAVVQRVTTASVTVDGVTIGAIGKGLLVLLGVGAGDNDAAVEFVANKIASLRIFEDDEGRMNRGVQDVNGAILAVSQFTLYGDVRKGRCPSFVAAMEPAEAKTFFDRYVERTRSFGIPVETGKFGAMMDVQLTNDGPVTILIDSNKVF